MMAHDDPLSQCHGCRWQKENAFKILPDPWFCIRAENMDGGISPGLDILLSSILIGLASDNKCPEKQEYSAALVNTIN